MIRIYYQNLFSFSPPLASQCRYSTFPGLIQAFTGEAGSHPGHAGMGFQCSSQLGLGGSKSNLVLETLKQRTRKTVLRRDNWFIFLKIQLTHPLLPCQMPPMAGRNFLFPPLRHCLLIRLTRVIKEKKISSEQLLKICGARVDGPAGWPTSVTSLQVARLAFLVLLLPCSFLGAFEPEEGHFASGHCERGHSLS